LGRDFHIPSLRTPPGWVDSHPVLSHQPLSHLGSLLVRYTVLVPIRTWKASGFSDRWTVAMFGLFGKVLDVGQFISKIWTINIPTGLREVLWKDALGSLPFYCSEWVSSKASFTCGCGLRLSLDHIFTGCASYDLSPLSASLTERLAILSPPFFICAPFAQMSGTLPLGFPS